jgi:Icc protein
MDRRQFLKATSTVLFAAVAGCAREKAKPPEAAGNIVSKAPDPIAEPTPEQPFRVALLSDVHVQYASSPLADRVNPKLEKAVADFQREVQPDRWLVNGDIADHGIPAEFDVFKKIMGKVTKPGRLLVNSGNHEFYDFDVTDDVSLDRFYKAFGVTTTYSSHVVAGVHIVMLGDEQWKTAPRKPDWCWITPAQMAWFEQVLTEHKEKFTVVCMHQPLNETVIGSTGENAFGGTNMAKEIYALLEKNPQVKLWFSGHTHRRIDTEGQVVVKNGVTFVGLGSTIYLLSPPTKSGERSKRDEAASQSRLLEIYSDRVVVRARDHTAARWMDDLQITIPRT